MTGVSRQRSADFPVGFAVRPPGMCRSSQAAANSSCRAFACWNGAPTFQSASLSARPECTEAHKPLRTVRVVRLRVRNGAPTFQSASLSARPECAEAHKPLRTVRVVRLRVGMERRLSSRLRCPPARNAPKLTSRCEQFVSCVCVFEWSADFPVGFAVRPPGMHRSSQAAANSSCRAFASCGVRLPQTDAARSRFGNRRSGPAEAVAKHRPPQRAEAHNAAANSSCRAFASCRVVHHKPMQREAGLETGAPGLF